MNDRPPSLAGWLLRDATLSLLLVGLMLALSAWSHRQPATAIVWATVASGFLASYVTSYVVHEWGHLLGGRLAGSRMPLLPYQGALLASFDIAKHDSRQYLWLSWGGIGGYLGVLGLVCTLLWNWDLGAAGQGLLIGVLAFSSQSLAVDLPQVLKVHSGGDPVRVSRAGTRPGVILRKTVLAWLTLGAAVYGWRMLL